MFYNFTVKRNNNDKNEIKTYYFKFSALLTLYALIYLGNSVQVYYASIFSIKHYILLDIHVMYVQSCFFLRVGWYTLPVYVITFLQFTARLIYSFQFNFSNII